MWVNVILVQNGLGLYAAWSFILAVTHFGFILNYDNDVSMTTTSWISLIIHLVYVVFYFLFEIIISPASLRYQFTPYLAYIWCLAGIVSNDDIGGEVYQTLAVVLLIVCVVVLLIKSIISIARARKYKTTLETSC